VPVTPEERFDKLSAAFAHDPEVSLPSEGNGFGSGGLRHRGKIFAMLTRGHLVVKLPSTRVDLLGGSGDGARFDGNKGRPMREWFTLDPDSTLDWESLAREAMAFVSSNQPGKRR
jgi:TfoX/Sxy family transcriptional regulator of competence genes